MKTFIIVASVVLSACGSTADVGTTNPNTETGVVESDTTNIVPGDGATNTAPDTSADSGAPNTAQDSGAAIDTGTQDTGVADTGRDTNVIDTGIPAYDGANCKNWLDVPADGFAMHICMDTDMTGPLINTHTCYSRYVDIYCGYGQAFIELKPYSCLASYSNAYYQDFASATNLVCGGMAWKTPGFSKSDCIRNANRFYALGCPDL
jgi:hypothetical protein